MNRRHFFLVMTASLFIWHSCVNEEGLKVSEEGVGTLEIELNGISNTRATSKPLSDEEAGNFLITIYRGDEIAHETIYLKDLGKASFPAGNGYKVYAENCTAEDAESVNNGWGQRHYAGMSSAFSIHAGETTKVGVNCSVINAGICVSFNEDIQRIFKTFNLTINDGERTIIFDKEKQESIAYFNVDETGEHAINYTIHAEGDGVGTIDKSGTKTLEKAKVSRINITYNTAGNIGLTIYVDDEFIEKSEEIIIDPESNE